MVSLRFLSRLTKGCGRAYSVFFIILTMLVTLSACAYQERHAGSYDPAGDISERIANQQQRIDQADRQQDVQDGQGRVFQVPDRRKIAAPWTYEIKRPTQSEQRYDLPRKA